MKFVSFNINGLRAHIHQLKAIIKQIKPDVIGLQETKIQDNLFPLKEISQYGYNVYYYGQKQYHGVALFLKQPSLLLLNNTQEVIQHNKYDCFQTRFIIINTATSIGILTIINCYFPQGNNKNNLEKFEYKKIFYQNLQNYIKYNYNKNSLLLIMGDMNICPTDLDIGISEKRKQHWLSSGKCSFLPEERKWLHNLINWGLIDVYRYIHPQNNKYYSWFSYKSQGFQRNSGLRIDLILVTRPLIRYYKDSGVDYEIRKMHRPSDHAPVWVDFNI